MLCCPELRLPAEQGPQRWGGGGQDGAAVAEGASFSQASFVHVFCQMWLICAKLLKVKLATTGWRCERGSWGVRRK